MWADTMLLSGYMHDIYLLVEFLILFNVGRTEHASCLIGQPQHETSHYNLIM